MNAVDLTIGFLGGVGGLTCQLLDFVGSDPFDGRTHLFCSRDDGLNIGGGLFGGGGDTAQVGVHRFSGFGNRIKNRLMLNLDVHHPILIGEKISEGKEAAMQDVFIRSQHELDHFVLVIAVRKPIQKAIWVGTVNHIETMHLNKKGADSP